MTKYLSPKTVAEILDLHPSTAMRWIKSGKLPGVRIGLHTWRTPEEALERFIRKRMKKATLPQPDAAPDLEDNSIARSLALSAGNTEN
jgi:excisionase family DNA binding protein